MSCCFCSVLRRSGRLMSGKVATLLFCCASPFLETLFFIGVFGSPASSLLLVKHVQIIQPFGSMSMFLRDASDSHTVFTSSKFARIL